MLDCAVTAVSDDLHAATRVGHLLLLDVQPRAAARARRSVRDDGAADRARRPLARRMWARKIFPVRAAARDRGPGDARRPRRRRWARWLAPRRRASPPRVDALRLPGQARDQRARPAEAAAAAARIPAELQLGHDCSRSSSASTLLGAPRRAAGTSCRAGAGDAAHAELELCAGGVPAAYFRVGGRTFDRQDPLGRLTFQGAQHLQTLGALTDYDRDRKRPSATGRGSAGTGAYEWREATLRAPRRRALPLVARPARRRARRRAHARSATSRASRSTPHGELALSLRLWPGTPRAIAVRPLSTAFVRGAAAAGAAARRDARGRGGLADPAAAHVQPRAACCARWMPGPSASSG